MFTGIVEEIGIVLEVFEQAIHNLVKLCIACSKCNQDVNIGDSICVNGVCLTIIDFNEKYLLFNLGKETLHVTTLGKLKVNDTVNLERAVRADQRNSGHDVQGHSSCTAIIKSSKIVENGCTEILFQVPNQFKLYLIKKRFYFNRWNFIDSKRSK